MSSFLILRGKFHYFIVCFFLCVFLLDCSYATDRGSPAVRRPNERNSKCLPGWKRWPKKTGRCIVPICNNCGSRGKCIAPAKCCCSDGQLLNNCDKSASDLQETISPFADPECLCRNLGPHNFRSRQNLTHFECLDRGLNVLHVGQLPSLATPTYEHKIVRRSFTGKSFFGLDKVDRKSGLKKTFNRNGDFSSVFNKSSNINFPKSRITEKHGGDPKQSLKALSTKRNNPRVDLNFFGKQNVKIHDTGEENWDGDNIEEKNKDYTKKYSPPDMMNKFINNMYFQRHGQRPYLVKSQSAKTNRGKDYHTDNLHRFHEMLLGNSREGKYLKEFDDSAHDVEYDDYDFTYLDGTIRAQDILSAVRDSPPTTGISAVRDSPPTTGISAVRVSPPTTGISAVRDLPPTTGISAVRDSPPTTETKPRAYSDSSSFNGYKKVAQEIPSGTENYARTNFFNERKRLLENGLNKESIVRKIYGSITPGWHKKITPGSQPDKGNNERKQEGVNYKDTGSTEFWKKFFPDKGKPYNWSESLAFRRMFPFVLDEKTDAGSVPSYFKQNKHWDRRTSTFPPQQKMEKIVLEMNKNQQPEKMEKIVHEIETNRPQPNKEKIVIEMQTNQPQQKEKTAHDKWKIQPEVTADETVANSEFYQNKLKSRIFKDHIQNKTDGSFEKSNHEDTESEEIGLYPSKPVYPNEQKKIAPGKGNNERKQEGVNYKDTGSTKFWKKFFPDKDEPYKWSESLAFRRMFPFVLDEKTDAGSVPSYFKQNKHWDRLTSTFPPQQKMEKIVPEMNQNKPPEKMEKIVHEIEKNSHHKMEKIFSEIETNRPQPNMEKIVSEIQKNPHHEMEKIVTEMQKNPQQKMEKIVIEMQTNQPQQKEKRADDKWKIQPEVSADGTVANSEFYQNTLKSIISKDDIQNKTDGSFEKSKHEDTDSEKKGSYPSKPVYPKEHTDDDRTGTKKPLFLQEQLMKNATPNTETQNKNYSKTTQFSKSENDRSKIKQSSTTGTDYNDKKVLLEDKIPGNKKQSISYLTKQNKKVTPSIKESSVVEEQNNNNNKDTTAIIKTTKQMENENGMKYFDKLFRRQESHENIWKKYSNADDKTLIKGKFGFPVTTERVSEKRQNTRQSLADKLTRNEYQKYLEERQRLRERLYFLK